MQRLLATLMCIVIYGEAFDLNYGELETRIQLKETIGVTASSRGSVTSTGKTRVRRAVNERCEACSQLCLSEEQQEPECACFHGFVKSSQKHHCQDINECSRDPNLCQPGGRCINTVGSFVCRCTSGYHTSVSGRCVDVDECAKSPSLCTQICTNTPGNFECSCYEGFKLSSVSGKCEDINECELQADGCSHLCVNTDGSFVCRCPAPLQLADDGRTCVTSAKRHRKSPPITYHPSREHFRRHEFRTTREGRNLCQFTCLNRGSCKHGECQCPPGLTGNVCQIDVDECAVLPNEFSCSHHCTNSFGSFQCECNAGYVLGADRRSCSPLTCAPPCMGGGSCVSGTCVCPPGLTGPACGLDIDECESSPCQQLCRNTLGSFVCLCRGRWRLDDNGRTCLEPPCAPHCRNGGVCRSGRCVCKPGFQGRLCQLDVNECAAEDSPCKHACVNSFGSYQCLCPPGLRLSENRTVCLHDPLSDDQPRERERVDVVIEIVVEDKNSRMTHHTMEHMDIQLPWPPYTSKHSALQYKLMPHTHWHKSKIKPPVSFSNTISSPHYFDMNVTPFYSNKSLIIDPVYETSQVLPSQVNNLIIALDSSEISTHTQSSVIKVQSVMPVSGENFVLQSSHVNLEAGQFSSTSFGHQPVSAQQVTPSLNYRSEISTHRNLSSNYLEPSSVVINVNPVSSAEILDFVSSDQKWKSTPVIPQVEKSEDKEMTLVSEMFNFKVGDLENFSKQRPAELLLSETKNMSQLMATTTASKSDNNEETTTDPGNNLLDFVLEKETSDSITAKISDNLIITSVSSITENIDLLRDIANSLFPAQKFVPETTSTFSSTNFSVFADLENGIKSVNEETIMSSFVSEITTSFSPIFIEETPILSSEFKSEDVISTVFESQDQELLLISSTSVLTDLKSEVAKQGIKKKKQKHKKNKNKSRKQKKDKIGKDLQILNQILQSFDLQTANPGDVKHYEVIDLDAMTPVTPYMTTSSKSPSFSAPLPTRQIETINKTENDCLYNRKKYKSRSSFFRDEKNCTKCVCKDGELRCAPRHCPPPHCEGALHGDCCDYCPGDCVVEQQVYLPGERFSPYLDPCRECKCEAGRAVCHDIICPPLDCPEQYRALVPDECCPACIPPEPGCFWNGRFFYTGQLWVRRQGGCHACLCKASGEVQCNPVVCVVGCQHPQFVPGDCCPSCEGCQHHGHKYEHEQTFQHPSDPCSSCQCMYGNITCFERTCESQCSHPYKAPDKCCPECTDCMFESEHIKTGFSHSFGSNNGSCKECTCKDGEVSCTAIKCLPGCDVEGGQHVASGAQFSLGSDACTRCRCTEGKVECRAEPCPVQCSHGVLLPGSCCLDCTHCEYKGRIYKDLQVFRPDVEPCLSCLCARGNVLCQDTCESSGEDEEDEDEEEE